MCPGQAAEFAPMLAAATSPSIETILAEMREVRFANGRQCPRCDTDSVHRWGGFAGRQRYRCNGCSRTFSDLTGTPAAYAKKLTLWPLHSDCLAACFSVRRTAALLGIQPSTAFRWRHVWLDSLRARDVDKLSGRIECGWIWFPYSQKGQRNQRQPARRRGVRYRLHFTGRSVNVIVACDGHGRVISSLSDSMICSRQLEEALVGRIEGQPILCARSGPFGACGVLVRRLGGAFEQTAHLPALGDYVGRLKRWIERFRGVATKYLPNYLVWHRRIDLVSRHGVAAATMPWPNGDAFG
jgi:transposase-like protein